MNKVKLNPDKAEFQLFRKERLWSKCHSVFTFAFFPIERFDVKINLAKSARHLGVILGKTFTIHSHVFSVRAFTTLGFYSVSAVILVWLLKTYLRMLWCLAISVIAIHFYQIMRSLILPNFNMFRIAHVHVPKSPPFTLSL